jgi:hypothetical protein
MGGACRPHGREENTFKFMIGNLKERDGLKELGLHRRIILKWMLKTQVQRGYVRFSWLRIETNGGLHIMWEM